LIPLEIGKNCEKKSKRDVGEIAGGTMTSAERNTVGKRKSTWKRR